MVLIAYYSSQCCFDPDLYLSVLFESHGLVAQAYVGFETLVLAFTTLHRGWNPYLRSLILLLSV